MDRATLKERAVEVSRLANDLSDELANLKLPEPTFEHGLPAPLSSDAPDSKAGAIKLQLFQKLDEFLALLTEPSFVASTELRNPSLCVHPVLRLGIAANFPPEGATVQEIASKLKLGEKLVRRLLCACATHHVYYQASPDFFVHTASSRVLAENEALRTWLTLGFDEGLPANLKVPDALIRYPDSQEPQHCGWSVQNRTDLSIFQALNSEPERATGFAKAMSWHGSVPGYSPHYLVDAFPWPPGNNEFTVVDVGGSLGYISLALAQRNSNGKFIVEDIPQVVQAGEAQVPEAMRGRVSFRAHDFFQEQPVKDADVYLLRLVCHDWSDKYAAMIIKALIPALKPGAKVVINDRVLPALGEVHYLEERAMRDSDMYMLAFQNAKERTAEDWKDLFAEVDSRFKITKITRPAKSILAIVEATWDG